MFGAHDLTGQGRGRERDRIAVVCHQTAFCIVTKRLGERKEQEFRYEVSERATGAGELW